LEREVSHDDVEVRVDARVRRDEVRMVVEARVDEGRDDAAADVFFVRADALGDGFGVAFPPSAWGLLRNDREFSFGTPHRAHQTSEIAVFC